MIFAESKKHPIAAVDGLWLLTGNTFEANAALIAAAPEMYELLKLVHDNTFETLDEGGEAVVAISPDLIEKINLLLAKARGETKEAK